MDKKSRKWFKRPSLWIGAGCVLLFAAASACSDVTAPRIIPNDQDSAAADTEQVGFQILPMMQDDLWG